MTRLLADVARILDAAFPLHLVLDEEGCILRGGELATRVLRAGRGQPWREVLTVERPASVGSLGELEGRQVVARSVSQPELRVRGQVVSVGVNRWALLVSPVVEDLAALDRCGLRTRDLPAHDATADLLAAASGQAQTVQQLREALSDLRQTRDELEGRNHAVEAARRDLAEKNGILRDTIRAKQEAEAALRQGQKLEILGQLVGGITHDFNNLLVAILGHAAHGLEDAREPAAREALHGVYDAAERAAALTARLLTFSSPSPGIEGPVDISREVRQVAGLVRRLLQDHVQLDVRIEVQPAWVPLDRTSFEQILVNLAVNARDAMPHGGRLSVVVDHRRVDAGLAAAMGVEPGTHVCLSVQDEGVGMPSEVVERIFEPFYSTKGPGRGTGLGLSTVFGLARAAGGAVQVASQVGRGTTFSVWLPQVEAPRGQHPVGRMRERVPVSEGSVILLVDDEPQIRRVVGRMLSKAGWQVRQATSASNALERLPAVGELALVITDQNMPGRTGVDLVDDLRARGHNVPCILMSGYSDDPRLTEGARRGLFRLLPKPFDNERLLQAIDRTITRTRLSRLGETDIEPPTMPSWIGRVG